MSTGNKTKHQNQVLYAESLNVGGTAVTSTAAELNILTGVTASASEINSVVTGNTATAAEITRVAKPSARIVTTTATTLSLTVTQHAERIVLVNTNSTVANTISLPVATGSGAKLTVINNIAQTQGSVVVGCTGTVDVIKGIAYMVNSTVTNQAQAFATSASSTKVTFNRTTTGGAVGGEKVVAYDVAANTWNVEVTSATSGTTATPFSA